MEKVLVEADFFISYLRDDELADKSGYLLDLALSGRKELFVSSEVYDDIITAYRSKGYAIEDVLNILLDLRSIPHEVVPSSLKIVIEALELYRKYGGGRKLHYFDSFHVSTSISSGMPLITSDGYILRNSKRMGVKTIDLRKVEDIV